MLRFCRFGLLSLLVLTATAANGMCQSPGTEKLIQPARDLNSPEELNDLKIDASKRSVLIYYANETAPDEAEGKNYRQIIESLGGSQSPVIQKIVTSLQFDLKNFHKVIDEEVEALHKNITSEKPEQGVSVALFTNRLVREGKFQLLLPGTSAPVERPLVVPRLKGMAYSSNPLSHPSVLQIALCAVSQQFDPDRFQFILVTKSHGTAAHVLTPRVWRDVSGMQPEALLAQLEQDILRQAAMNQRRDVVTRLDSFKTEAMLDSFKTEAMLDTWKTDGMLDFIKVGQDAASILQKDGLDGDSLGDDSHSVGTTKEDYVAILDQVSQATGMQFPLLFIESCRSEFDQGLLQQMRARQSSIGRLYTSDLKGLEYTTLDYDKVFQHVRSGDSMAIAMHRELFAKYSEQKSAREQTARGDSNSPESQAVEAANTPGSRDASKSASEDISKARRDSASSAESPHSSAFDRFVHRDALAAAWLRLESMGITDGALQMLEAERVLGQPSPELPAEQLFMLAVRLAIEANDQSSLARLENGAAQASRQDLAAAAVLARKTAAPSRNSSPMAPVTPQDAGGPTAFAFGAFQHDIQSARLCGDARALDAIESDLSAITQFTPEQHMGLQRQIDDARAGATTNSQLPSALDRLVSGSRGWKWQGVNSRYEVPQYNSTLYSPPSSTPQKPRPTGPALGQTGKSQAGSSWESMSYEQRQAAIRLLNNPNSIRPTPAR